jgi:hypothetical protein
VLSLLRRVRACLRNEEVIHSRWLGRVTVAFFASGRGHGSWHSAIHGFRQVNATLTVTMTMQSYQVSFDSLISNCKTE